MASLPLTFRLLANCRPLGGRGPALTPTYQRKNVQPHPAGEMQNGRLAGEDKEDHRFSAKINIVRALQKIASALAVECSTERFESTSKIMGSLLSGCELWAKYVFGADSRQGHG
ncbi:hypothetical protein EVAR_52952_1 [Eumeta japonica]|uniref:Uncharacterized protein n=1 Tax=Eumeta variegata TaxID=151549 RepID=A0A4C1XRZ1_EUMVA|nr:hypothetical protein EVAR_52952_1 [Eumeta japonica]